jgi:ribonuclease HII
MVAIDDYGIGSELKDYIKTIEKEDVKVIVKHKADEEYTACKIASLVARALRVKEIDELNKKFVLVEESTSKKIYPNSGSSSNSNTEKYLKVFRKQNPTLDFPSFVRKKWNNVKLIDRTYPKN